MLKSDENLDPVVVIRFPIRISSDPDQFHEFAAEKKVGIADADVEEVGR